MRTFLLAGAAVLAVCGIAWATGYQDFNLGIAAGNRDDGDAAVQSLTRALAAPDLPQHLRATTFVARGRAFAFKKQYDAAISDFTAALRLKPNYTEAYANRAAVYAESRRFGEAIADVTNLIRIDPYNLEMYVSRMGLYGETGRYEDAIEDCNTILALWPKLPVELKPSPEAPIYWQRGRLYRILGQYDRAIADDDTAIALNDKLAAAYADRGRTRLLKGNFAEAGADLDRAVDLSTSDVSARGSIVGGVDYSIHTDAGSVLWTRGFADWNLGQFDAAKQSFAEVATRYPKDAYPFLGLAISSTKATLPEVLEKAGSADLDHWPGPILAVWLGKSTTEELNAAITLHGGKDTAELRCQMNFYLGEWQLRRNDPVAARKLLQAAATDCPPDVVEMQAAQVELGRALVADTNL